MKPKVISPTHRLWLILRSRWPALASDDLLRNATYRRLWTSILISSFGGQITMLALPLTAAVMLQATPFQMGLLTAMEIAPFVLLSLPTGVWLDRVRKLPIYVMGEGLIALVLATVPLAWYLGWLTMTWMYGVAFTLGCIFVVAGTAAQIVLTQVVPRERLVEAHAKNALASSGAEVAGPGVAGVLIKLAGAPLALLADAVLLVVSVLILRGVQVVENRILNAKPHFWSDLKEGLRFVASQPLLISLALVVGLWQMCYHCTIVVQILFATRELGLNERQVGLCYVGLGAGTVLASTLGHRISLRLGPGPCLVLGVAVCGTGWLQLALAPANAWGVASFVLMLLCFSAGAVLIFINFLALRQAVTPEPLLGRMTSTMRWLILIPAGPGALLGGYLGEHLGLRYALALGGIGALLLAAWAWRHPVIRYVRVLPQAVAVPAGLQAAR
ncbi:MFS transporter [Rhodoferax sp.]|uniref:MFS transporter n=1 Tax=Rhodoferax sp. TaxID=50421 RepID=UPI002616AA80|nr:MFS transporter [Rhodoferax sp.]MDD2920413.1 MFS transporter [Rhodoferax sp.]